METRHILALGAVLVIIFAFLLGAMSYQEKGKPTAKEYRDAMVWEYTHDALRK